MPAFTNHTDNVEKTSKIGRPDEKPKQIILSGLSLKKIFNVPFFPKLEDEEIE